MVCAHSSGKSAAAFTLVEMLVSVAVLILIMVFVSQMMNSTLLSTTASGKHEDADGQARLVFDRMAEDFGRMPRRTDVDFIFSKQPDPSLIVTGSGSSDKMFFYTEASGYYNTTVSGSNRSSVALAGYCINTSGTNPLLPAYSLLRLCKGLSWDASLPANGPGGMLFLTSPSPSATPFPASSLPGAPTQPNWNGAIGFNPTYNGTDLTDYDLLSNAVLRLEFCFEVKDLTNPSSPATAYSNYPIAHFSSGSNQGTHMAAPGPGSGIVGDRWYDTSNNRAYLCTSVNGTVPYWTPNGMSDVTAIIVAIAILDTNSRKLVPNQLAAISSDLPDPTENQLQLSGSGPQLMAEQWQGALNATSPTFASTAGIPIPVASQIRVYQRFFYLNNL